jgi:ribosomal protein L4
MAAPKAPVLGGTKKEVSLDEAVFAAEVKPHLVHEAVRAELNARRRGRVRRRAAASSPAAARSRGARRARDALARARSAHRSSPAAASPSRPAARLLAQGQQEGSPGRAACRAQRPRAGGHARPRRRRLLRAPSTKQAVELLQDWGQEAPTVLVASEDEVTLIKSFRNLPRVLVTVPAELEVAHVVWARSLVVSESALPLVQGKAGGTS